MNIYNESKFLRFILRSCLIPVLLVASTMSLTMFRTAVASKLPSVALPERIRGGRIQRVVEYWKTVARDYAESMVQVKTGAAARPVKAAALTATGLGIAYANKTNPGERDLRDRFIGLNQDIMCLSEEMRNSQSESHQISLATCYNLETLRIQNLGVATLVWRDDISSNCGTFESQCSYLKVGYLEMLRDRVVDVGFLGQWWMTDAKMAEYDVNAAEWDVQGRPTNPDKQLKQMW
jgi:hypothetical protein